MTSRKASNVVDMPDSAASTQRPGEAKLTWNKRLGDESLTIRVNTVEELMEIREQLARTLPPVAESGLHEGGDCPRSGCTGKLQLRNGSKGRFYGCSSFPACRFTSAA